MTGGNKRDFEVFEEAIKLSAEERITFLDRVCAGDEDLRQRVEKLLKSHERAGDYMERPPTEWLAEVKAKVNLGEKPGDRIDRYKLLEQIGEGGWGIVFRAEQEAPISRRVALKVVKPGMDTKSVIARFEAERQALALMDHPNIAHVFDAGATQSGRPYFVMELVEGTKITQYCDQHSLPITVRLELFVQVCDAVQHAHQKGIVHRDIKPSNIVVTTGPDGKPTPKVIDFGIAKAIVGQCLTQKTIFTRPDMLMGTPAYMSPEQAVLASTEVDTRTDIYSLGVLLYELLIGTTPFDAQELLKAGLDEVRRVIREEEPVRPSTRLGTMGEAELAEVCEHRHSEPSSLIRQLRGDLDWIVMKAVEKDRDRRYATANGLALDVKRYMAGEAVLACPPSKLYRFQKTVRRNRLLFSGVGVIALLLVTSLIVVSAVLAKERRLRREAETASIKSQEIATFLEDALAEVNPSVSLGQDTTLLRGILDRTVERIDKQMTNQPEAKAELENVIGTVYQEIGNFRRAEEMHRSALKIRRQLFGSDDLRVARSLNDLGLELRAENKLPEAERAVTEALAIRQRALGTQNADTATSMNDLSAIYQGEGKLSEAEALTRQSLAIRQGIFGKTNLAVADSLRNLTLILGVKGKWAESEATARQVLTIREKLLGREHPWVAATLNDIAWVENKEGKFKEAEMLQREALAIRRKLLPADHPDVAESLALVGDTLRKQGNLGEAYSILTAALSIQRKLLGDDDPASIYTLSLLGLTLNAESKLTEAETVCSNVLVLSRKKMGNESRKTLDAMSNLGTVLQNESKWPEAETLFRQQLELSHRIAKPDDPTPLYIIHNLALALEGERKLPEAEALHREESASWRQRTGDDDPRTLYAMRHLAATYELEGKWSEAESMHREALALWQKRAGNQDGDISYTREGLIRALQAEHKWPEAESVVHQEIAFQRLREGDTGDDTLNRMNELGLILEAGGKWSEAERVHRDVLALRRKKAGDADPKTFYALRNLAEMFEREGKISEAENFYRQEFESWRKLMGNGDPQTFYSRRKLGLLLEAEGKWPEAEAVFRDSLILSSNRGKRDPEAVADLERLVGALMPQKKFGEAQRLLDEVLTSEFTKDPSSVSLVNELVNVMGRQGRWREAAAETGLLLQLQPMEPYHYHRLAALFAISQNRPAYEQLCQKMTLVFTNTANPYVAERIANDCLLLPRSGVDLKSVDKLADLAVTRGSNESAMAYFEGCKAMSEYRQGDCRNAIEWANKAINSPTAEAQAKAKAFAVLAMANWQLGQKDAARTALIDGNKLAPALSPKGDTDDLGESWVAWLMARVSLDEAASLTGLASDR